HDHFPVADLFLQRGYRIADEMRRRPILFAAADIDQEIFNDLLPLDTMINFRMELQTIQGIFSVFASTSNTSGSSRIVSAWLIQTCDCSLTSPKSAPFFCLCSNARPYSRRLLLATRPPNCLAVS